MIYRAVSWARRFLSKRWFYSSTRVSGPHTAISSSSHYSRNSDKFRNSNSSSDFLSSFMSRTRFSLYWQRSMRPLRRSMKLRAIFNDSSSLSPSQNSHDSASFFRLLSEVLHALRIAISSASYNICTSDASSNTTSFCEYCEMRS